MVGPVKSVADRPWSPRRGPARVAQCPDERRSGARGEALSPCGQGRSLRASPFVLFARPVSPSHVGAARRERARGSGPFLSLTSTRPRLDGRGRRAEQSSADRRLLPDVGSRRLRCRRVVEQLAVCRVVARAVSVTAAIIAAGAAGSCPALPHSASAKHVPWVGAMSLAGCPATKPDRHHQRLSGGAHLTIAISLSAQPGALAAVPAGRRRSTRRRPTG